jgi:hypothetical protein
MFIEYTSLNKACLKDPFPPRRVDQVIDLTAGCLLGISPDTTRRGVSAHQHIHHSFQLFLLCKNAIQTKEHGGYIPALYAILL